MLVHRRASCVLTVALLIAGPIWAAAAAPTATDPVAAVATDQPCTAHATAGATLGSVGFRADDVAAMTLPRSTLGRIPSGYAIDWFHYGFIDNAELGHVELAPAGLCALDRAAGRILGFARAFAGDSGEHQVASETDLFFTSAGAAAWLRGFVAGLRELPGSGEVTAVRVTTLAGPGTGARLVTVRFRNGSVSSWLLFRRGRLLGSVLDSRPATAAPAVDVRSVARALSSRMSQRIAVVAARRDSRYDAVWQLSAGLPRADLGSRYSGLVWDWWYGGCWDVEEGASQAGAIAQQRAYKRAADKYGQLAYCRATYVPPHDAQAYNRVSRVFTGGTLYATSAGADGALTQIVGEWQHRAGTTTAGLSYGPLTRFSPGPLGDRSVGLQQRMGSIVLIRIYSRYGPYLAVSQLATTGFSGMRADVKRWASLLDGRVRALTATRTW